MTWIADQTSTLFQQFSLPTKTTEVQVAIDFPPEGKAFRYVRKTIFPTNKNHRAALEKPPGTLRKNNWLTEQKILPQREKWTESMGC